MRTFKLNTITKKLGFIVSLVIIIALLAVSCINYIIARDELLRSNGIILKNAVETSMFEINNNYNYAFGETPWMTEDQAKKISLDIIGELNAGQTDTTSNASQTDADASSGATEQTEVDASSSATEQTEKEAYSSLDLGENGYFFIVNSDGDVITHPFLEDNLYDLKSKDGRFIIQELIETAKGDGGTLSYALNDDTSKDTGNRTVYTEYFPEWDWVVTAVIYDSDLLRGPDRMVKFNIITLAIVVAVSLTIIIFNAKRITRPINKLSTVLGKVSTGDLTVDKLNIKSKDETKVLANSVNSLIDQLTGLVQRIIGSSKNLSDFSVELNQSCDTVSDATTAVSKAISEIAVSSDEQSRQIREGVQKIISLGNDIKETAAAGVKVESTASQTMQLKEEGLYSVNNLKAASSENSTNSSELEVVIAKMNEQSQQIGAIINIIAGIADQTSLLALNASIEAARAGENGRGFAVVAEEVRALADETMSATEDITNKINEMQVQSEKAVDFVNKNALGVGKINETVQQTEIIFDKISDELQKLIVGIETITSYNFEVDKKKDNILEMLNHITQSAEETSTSIEEISSSSEDQAATMVQITTSFSQLNEMVKDLNDLIGVFKLPS